MRGDPEIIEHLNRVLFNELVAINQYFLHAKTLKSWGFAALADHEYGESIGEMKHADRLIERILLLEGLPNLQELGKLSIGEDVPEILQCDLKLEQAALPDLKAAIAACESAGDYASRELLASILEEEEAHYDWLETQIELVGKLGLQNYLQSQLA